MSEHLDASLTYSDLSNLLLIVNTQTIEEQIVNGMDNRLIYTSLKHYLKGIETGINNKRNFSLQLIINKITENNIDEICKTLHCALQIQADNTEYINTFLYLQSQGISLTNLKIMNVLLCNNQHTQVINTNLLCIYLNYIFDDVQKEEYSFFVSNLLEKFLCFDLKATINLIWSKCYVHKSLNIFTSIPTKYLFTPEWIDILKQDAFWELLMEELGATEGYRYKIAIFMLKLSLDVLKTVEFRNNYIACGKDDEICKSFDHFCLLLDVSREKQSHLIEPSLNLLNKLKLPRVWHCLIYNKLLCHPHSSVAYLSLLYFMKLAGTCDSKSIFIALNKSDDSMLCKQVFRKFQLYCAELTKEKYIDLMTESLDIVWNPVAFYNFYKNTLIRPVDNNILIEIIKKCKQLPHKYIRQGIMFIIFSKIKNDVKQEVEETICISKYLNIIIELIKDDAYYKYATNLINLNKIVVSNEFLNDTKQNFLKNSSSPNIKLRVDILIELTERKDIPIAFIKELYTDFKQRKYPTVILDRLSYLYLVKASDLQEYLCQRLDSNEETHSIRQMDNPNYELITKSITILLSSNKSTNQQMLAFEILFYMTRSNYNNVYNYWFEKILNDNHILPSNLALYFVNLLIKIPTNFGKQRFDKILAVYSKLFNTQHDEVLVRIYRNFDFILEHIEEKDFSFLEISCKRLFYLKARDDLENSVRYLVRSIALNYKTINKKVLEFLLRKLYQAALDGSCADLVIYYSTMYFRYLNFDYELFPMYQFLLYPGDILNKNERAEYEICTEIYLDIHQNSPYFRAAEIRKWALEDVLFDVKPKKITQTMNYLLDTYKKTYNKRYFPDSTLHLQKLRTMQVFTFLLPHISTESPSLKECLTNFLLESFSVESHQTSVRLLMQYLLVQLLKENQNALDIMLQALEQSNKVHTSTITGLLPVLYGLELIKENSEFSHKIIENVIVWTMGPNFKLRLYSQKLIKEICFKHRSNFKFKKYESLYKAVDTALQTTTGENLFLDFDLMNIINRDKPWSDHKKLVHLVIVYIPEVSSVCTSEWEYFKVKHFWSKYLNENLNQLSHEFDDLTLSETSNENVQRKISPWQDIFENEDRSKITGRLIVVSSLIESAANLGGLSRTCEIFGGYMLVVDNIKVLGHKEFSSLSMTSEKWLNITEVKSQNLPGFLGKCKEQGYRIIGIEQTSDSVHLETYKFPEKTLLLLGNERSGIPAPLIALMDDCVEIQQVGMIRSLNVHVAGALAIWEYSKQNMRKSL